MRRLFLLAGLMVLLLPTQSWAALAHSLTHTYEHVGPSGSFPMAAVAVTGGTLLVLCVKNNASSGTSTLTGATATGGDTFTLLTNQSHSANNPFARCGYILSATGNASYIVTMAFSTTNTTYVRATLYAFTYTGTASLDVEVGSTEDNNDLTPSSNDLTTTGTDEVCVAMHADNGTQTFTASSETIGGSAGAGVTKISGDTDFFYRLISGSTFTGASTLTRNTVRNWVQRVSCFKATAGGGAATPQNLLMMGMGS